MNGFWVGVSGVVVDRIMRIVSIIGGIRIMMKIMISISFINIILLFITNHAITINNIIITMISLKLIR